MAESARYFSGNVTVNPGGMQYSFETVSGQKGMDALTETLRKTIIVIMALLHTLPRRKGCRKCIFQQAGCPLFDMEAS